MLNYGGFVKLMLYLPHEEVITRNDEHWFRWKNYYFCRRFGENLIRKGSCRESDTIYIDKYLSKKPEWIGKIDEDLSNLINESYDYWDLNIG
jgi:hypothetical protein